MIQRGNAFYKVVVVIL